MILIGWIGASGAGDVRTVLAKITHHDYSNKIKDKMAKFTKDKIKIR